MSACFEFVMMLALWSLICGDEKRLSGSRGLAIIRPALKKCFGVGARHFEAEAWSCQPLRFHHLVFTLPKSFVPV